VAFSRKNEILFCNEIVGIEQQVQILADLAQKEAVHAIFELFALNIGHSSIATLRSKKINC
jgi:hypothetical protein